MTKTDTDASKHYFEEVSRVLPSLGVEPQLLSGEALPVRFNGEPLCHVTENGIRYFPDDINSNEKEVARDNVSRKVSLIGEYMRLMETVPFLSASGLDEQYKLLADFNGTVLAGRSGARNGVQFVTWDWDFDRRGVNQGHYLGNDYEAAKSDFAIRCGLVDKHRLFSNEQLTAVYQGCGMLEDEVILSDQQYKMLRDIRGQIECALPDVAESIAAAERQNQAMEPQMNM